MKLFLHADDFGMNPAVSNGIIEGFTDGLLTSTSLLANAPHAVASIELWKGLEQRRLSGELPSIEHRRSLLDPEQAFDFGVHLNLTQGRPMTSGYPTALLDAQGRFPGIFRLYGRLLRGGSRWKTAIAAELHCQIEFMKNHSIQPTHLNGHQYCEILPVVRDIVPELMAKHGIAEVRVAVEWYWKKTLFWQRLGPVPFLLGGLRQHYAKQFRNRCKKLGITSPDAFFGAMLAGRIDMRHMAAFLDRAKSCLSTEIGMHPAAMAASDETTDGWHDPLAAVRPTELAMLKSPELYDLFLSHKVTLGRMIKA